MGAVWAIVPAAGSGQRFSQRGEDKLMASLTHPKYASGAKQTSVLAVTVATLLSSPALAGVVIVASKEKQPQYQSLLQAEGCDVSRILWAKGGASRADSVYAGLQALPEDCVYIAVHDAARPLLDPAWIGQGEKMLKEGAKGVVVALPVVDTIKQCQVSEVGENAAAIEKTLPRKILWRAQTPQMFERNTLLLAYERIGFTGMPDAAFAEITDDAQVLELAQMGPVKLLPGRECNLKITTPGDLSLAQAFINDKTR